MKLLTAYDGSRCSEAALDDLVRAGLPDHGEAMVISVAEVWLPPPNGNGPPTWEITGIKPDPRMLAAVEKLYQKNREEVAEAATLAEHAKRRMQNSLPDWKVQTVATYGSPAWEILSAADEFGPDLIVLGSHGRSRISRFFLGSISQKVLTEARCSVRVSRGRNEVDTAPVRIIIGFDASRGAAAAVDAVSRRSWPANTEVRMVTATESLMPSAIGRFVDPAPKIAKEVNAAEREWIEGLAAGALTLLTSAGLKAELHVHSGNPKEVLVEEAERWDADSIFVGANAAGGRVERFLLGSTSAAVAARAHCSVEVVRAPSS